MPAVLSISAGTGLPSPTASQRAGRQPDSQTEGHTSRARQAQSRPAPQRHSATAPAHMGCDSGSSLACAEVRRWRCCCWLLRRGSLRGAASSALSEPSAQARAGGRPSVRKWGRGTRSRTAEGALRRKQPLLALRGAHLQHPPLRRRRHRCPHCIAVASSRPPHGWRVAAASAGKSREHPEACACVCGGWVGCAAESRC